MKYNYIFAVLFLGTLLLVPFALKTYNHNLEVYPSVILPAGASLFQKTTDATSMYTVDLIIGFDKNTHQKKILNKIQFIAPAKPHYFKAILAHNFGLNTSDSTALNATKQWLKNKLKDQNCIDSIFIVKKIEQSFKFKTLQKNISEQYFDLYKCFD